MAEYRDLAYQRRVLATLDDYLAKLRLRTDQVEAMFSQSGQANSLIRSLDIPAEVWTQLNRQDKLPQSRYGIPYSQRLDGTGRHVPNVVYKIPTAGGKTYLAVSSLSRIFTKYLAQSTGFVLWVVPNEAIYTQTIRQLRDRRHPLRQQLDNLSGNRVKIMEKTNTLHVRDVSDYFCVMLLMLQAANRRDIEQLKIFRNSGSVVGFAPDEGDQLAQKRAVKEIPNLDVTESGLMKEFRPGSVIDSLSNAFRFIRPVLVMDEGHKAVSEQAFDTLYGFNPSFVLELTATPKDVKISKGRGAAIYRHQNLLVEVSGLELDQEGMIKMPINLDSRQGNDWRATLHASLERLNGLSIQAGAYEASDGRYIRPIMIVQVERTGRQQRDGRYVHAQDVEDWLLSEGHLNEDEIAVKTADANDLSLPENEDLLSRSNRIRVIITKQALQEGWDCSFAYVLCSLSSSSSELSMTQLVGRILRQPYAQKTGIDVLDECYIITHHRATSRIVQTVKAGLERIGLQDLSHLVSVGSDIAATDKSKKSVNRNRKFLSKKIFLPKVLKIEDGMRRDLNYEGDILSHLDWTNIDLASFSTSIPDNYTVAKRQLYRLSLSEGAGRENLVDGLVGSPLESSEFDFAHSTQRISDIVLNPWVARGLVGDVISKLFKRGFSSQKIGRLSLTINEMLRTWLLRERDVLAERLFRHQVAVGGIQFRLQTSGRIGDVNWQMPDMTTTRQAVDARKLLRDSGGALQKSLFSPQYEDDLNADERQVAVYLDGDSAVSWWHRNISRNHYYLQGWRKDRIFPDFICALRSGKSEPDRLLVLEMKGEHLVGNEDTLYKQAMLKLLTEAFDSDDTERVGEMEIMFKGGASVRCDLVSLSEWKTRLPKLLQ